MRIVIAPDSFKESLSAREACAAIARGIRSVRPDVELDEIPIADGGEGTVEALVAATGGTLQTTEVTGPLDERVHARWGLLGNTEGTAVLEMASASGLALVPPDRRNPLYTTTYGTGELIRAAMDAGARRILLGIGGSATTDGGTGAAQAMGVRFLTSTGSGITSHLVGGELPEIARIDMSGRDPRIAQTEIRVACDVDNPLCGPRGAAAVYGPQKGAAPEDVQTLDTNLARLADLIRDQLGIDVQEIPGAGAAGGLGAGMIAFAGARLERGISMVLAAVRFAERLHGADLVITGEGRLDQQSMMGKVISGVGRAAQGASVPVVALVGSVGDGAEVCLEVLRCYRAVTPPGTSLNEALQRAPEFLEAAAAQLTRELE